MIRNDNKSQFCCCSVSNDRDVGGCGGLDLDRELRGAVRRSRRGRGLLLVALALGGYHWGPAAVRHTTNEYAKGAEERLLVPRLRGRNGFF